MRKLPLIIAWGTWLARNRKHFEDHDPSYQHIVIECASIYESIPVPIPKTNERGSREEQIRGDFPWAYFDGTSDQRNLCGAGIVIHLNAQKCLKALMGL